MKKDQIPREWTPDPITDHVTSIVWDDEDLIAIKKKKKRKKKRSSLVLTWLMPSPRATRVPEVSILLMRGDLSRARR